MRWGILAAAVLYGAVIASAAVSYAGGADALRLSLEAPQVTAEIQVRPDATRHVLHIRIGAIENPSLTPFGIVARLPDGHEIGRFAVFPADRTGDYFLSLKPDERAALAKNSGALTLEIDWIGKPDPSLSVTVDFVRAE